jgi:GDPmannose 4,6-dehydratase
MKVAFITGITGQDGSYLAELLLAKGYSVHGLVRRSSGSNLFRISHLCNTEEYQGRFFLHDGDLGDFSGLLRCIETIQPDEIYNLAAMSHVKTSFDIPEYTCDIDALGTLRILEAVRQQTPQTKFYQASTSELFGNIAISPQNEHTPFHPRSPYGIAKLYAYWTTVNYREAYGIFACNGILFNHESPRRSAQFVTRKITLGVAQIARGGSDPILLGNLSAKRDWGYAKEYVEGMWLMLQQKHPEDFVLATGKTSSVKEFTTLAFQEIGIELEWEGFGVNEKGRDKASGRILVAIAPALFRPAEVDHLIGDASKARQKLGWSPGTSFEQLVSLMVQADLEAQMEQLV